MAAEVGLVLRTDDYMRPEGAQFVDIDRDGDADLHVCAVGRRSYMFAGNDRAAARSATFYTWVETRRLHDVDPPTWLADVLPRIATTRPSEYADLLPRRWAELRKMTAAA